MSPNSFFTPLLGQSLLYPGQAERYRGQCVQSVLLWLKATGTNPPIYPQAANYWDNGIPGYTKIPVGQPILAGDIVVWRHDFPPAIFTDANGNKTYNGHIDVASDNGSLSSFSAYDSNWIPLKLAHILHTGNNNNYIAGYLRKQGGTMSEPIIGDESTVRSLMASLNVKLTDAQVKYYAARSYGNFYTDIIGIVNQQRLDGLLKPDAVMNGFRLAMGRDATADELAYWTGKDPSIFLSALYGTKLTGLSTLSKQSVINYLNTNLK